MATPEAIVQARRDAVRQKLEELRERKTARLSGQGVETPPFAPLPSPTSSVASVPSRARAAGETPSDASPQRYGSPRNHFMTPPPAPQPKPAGKKGWGALRSVGSKANGLAPIPNSAAAAPASRPIYSPPPASSTTYAPAPTRGAPLRMPPPAPPKQDEPARLGSGGIRMPPRTDQEKAVIGPTPDRHPTGGIVMPPRSQQELALTPPVESPGRHPTGGIVMPPRSEQEHKAIQTPPRHPGLSMAMVAKMLPRHHEDHPENVRARIEERKRRKELLERETPAERREREAREAEEARQKTLHLHHEFHNPDEEEAILEAHRAEVAKKEEERKARIAQVLAEKARIKAEKDKRKAERDRDRALLGKTSRDSSSPMRKTQSSLDVTPEKKTEEESMRKTRSSTDLVPLPPKPPMEKKRSATDVAPLPSATPPDQSAMGKKRSATDLVPLPMPVNPAPAEAPRRNPLMSMASAAKTLSMLPRHHEDHPDNVRARIEERKRRKELLERETPAEREAREAREAEEARQKTLHLHHEFHNPDEEEAILAAHRAEVAKKEEERQRRLELARAEKERAKAEKAAEKAKLRALRAKAKAARAFGMPAGSRPPADRAETKEDIPDGKANGD